MKNDNPLVAAESFSIQTNELDGPKLTELAMAILRGDVFASWMVNGMDREQLAMVFIPLDKQPLKSVAFSYTAEQADEVVHVYQFLSESFFNKPNGYPSFKSCNGLKQKYVKPLMNELERLQKLNEEPEE